MTRSPRLLLATGGTGGHVYPALAVAREATSRGATVTVLGGAGGMEERLCAEAGVPFLGVSTGKWDRHRPDPRQALRALGGLWAARRLAREYAPDVVVGFGGFASLPGCAAARLLGVPLVLHEGNAFPSRVNRWFAGSSRLFVSAQPEALAHVRAPRTLVVPFPVREERIPREAARAALGLPRDAVVTLVMGGSQGSLTLNRAVPAAYLALPAPTDPERPHVVLHSTGPRWLAEVEGALAGAEARAAADARYFARPYLDAATAWSAADLAITRAGVGTLSEAAFHGVPTLMVPLPSAAEDHQRHNARAVAAAGAGVMLEEDDLGRLAQVWAGALEPTWRAQAAAAAAARTPAGAARRIVGAVLELVS